MKIVIRNHKKDNLVTNIRQNYTSVLVLSFLWNLRNSNTLRAGKIKFSGAQKYVLLKESPGECCAPHNFVHLVTLRGTCVCLIMWLTVHQIYYGKMKQCNNILQFPHVRAEMLSEKRKPRLCFPL